MKNSLILSMPSFARRPGPGHWHCSQHPWLSRYRWSRSRCLEHRWSGKLNLSPNLLLRRKPMGRMWKNLHQTGKFFFSIPTFGRWRSHFLKAKHDKKNIWEAFFFAHFTCTASTCESLKEVKALWLLHCYTLHHEESVDGDWKRVFGIILNQALVEAHRNSNVHLFLLRWCGRLHFRCNRRHVLAEKWQSLCVVKCRLDERKSVNRMIVLLCIWNSMKYTFNMFNTLLVIPKSLKKA